MESRRKARLWKYNHSISLWHKDLLDISAIEPSDLSFTVFPSTAFCSSKHFFHLFLFCLRMGLVQPGGLSYPEFFTMWPASPNCVGFIFLFGCSLNSLHLRPCTRQRPLCSLPMQFCHHVLPLFLPFLPKWRNQSARSQGPPVTWRPESQGV